MWDAGFLRDSLHFARFFRWCSTFIFCPLGFWKRDQFVIAKGRGWDSDVVVGFRAMELQRLQFRRVYSLLQSWSCMIWNDIEWYRMFNALEYDVEWFRMFYAELCYGMLCYTVLCYAMISITCPYICLVIIVKWEDQVLDPLWLTVHSPLLLARQYLHRFSIV